MLKLTTAVLFACCLTAAPAQAVVSDLCVKKLCTSLNQDDCWIKAGAAMCDHDQTQCHELPDHAPAIFERQEDRRVYVQTVYGTGWVSDLMLMISSDKC